MGPVTTVCLPQDGHFAEGTYNPVTIGWGETGTEGGASPILKQVSSLVPTPVNQSVFPDGLLQCEIHNVQFWNNLLL